MSRVRACLSWFRWASPVEEDGHLHMVRMVGRFDPSRNLDFAYACDCGEPQPCLHAMLVKGEHCGWRAEVDLDEPEKVRGTCPRCGGAVLELDEVSVLPPP